MAEGAKYIKETYKLDKTIQEIIDGINSVVYEFYEKEAMPKDGVLEFIEYLYDNKIPMTNYGTLIAYMNGILERSIEVFNTNKRK